MEECTDARRRLNFVADALIFNGRAFAQRDNDIRGGVWVCLIGFWPSRIGNRELGCVETALC
eukprot:scaffold77_cov163-Alexandrium_tamarense.AAC.6